MVELVMEVGEGGGDGRDENRTDDVTDVSQAIRERGYRDRCKVVRTLCGFVRQEDELGQG